jgi:hypothetical protein
MKKKLPRSKGISLQPLTLEDALRAAMKVDPKKVKESKPKKK